MNSKRFRLRHSCLCCALLISFPTQSLFGVGADSGIRRTLVEATATGPLPEAPIPQPGQANTADSIPVNPQFDVGGDQGEVRQTEREKAAEQINAQEKQRVLGILPEFNITYLGDATVSMTAGQKFGLAFRSVTDPVAFILPFFVAGYQELGDQNPGFPWGVKGLGERAGAAYLDAFDGAIIGNALLPSLLHQDPRYFRMGRGGTGRRLLYSVATAVICKHDKTGKWEPNYSNIGGNIAAGAISNLYYPSRDSGLGLTIRNGLVVSAEGALAAVFNEFWPDISRKFLHKDPTNGRDASLKAADGSEKH